MDKLDLAIALLSEARKERTNLHIYTLDYENLPSPGSPGYYEALNELDNKYPRIPTKSIINDKIKMARRLLLESYL